MDLLSAEMRKKWIYNDANYAEKDVNPSFLWNLSAFFCFKAILYDVVNKILPKSTPLQEMFVYPTIDGCGYVTLFLPRGAG